MNAKLHETWERMHAALDALLATYLASHRGKVPSNTTVTELMEWSAEQLRAGPKRSPKAAN